MLRIDLLARVLPRREVFGDYSTGFWLYFGYFPLPPCSIPRNLKTGSVYQMVQPVASAEFQ
jgi:hypothetical protein